MLYVCRVTCRILSFTVQCHCGIAHDGSSCSYEGCVVASALLSLSHREVEVAIRTRYFKAGVLNRETQMHELLAGYYLRVADPAKDDTWRGGNARALSAIPYHLVK